MSILRLTAKAPRLRGQLTSNVRPLNPYIEMILDTSTLPIFMSAIAALLIVPGPDFILITSQATSRGMRYGVACALGIGMAGVVQTILVALGLGKMMEAFPVVATAIRLCGALYLAYLGLCLLKSWWRNTRTVTQHQVRLPTDQSTTRVFLAGLANNLLNPKALLFFSVFIPQFVNPALGSTSAQIAALGLLLTLTALLYNIGVAFVFSKLRHLVIGRSALARHGDGLVGVLFLAIAGRLAVSRAA